MTDSTALDNPFIIVQNLSITYRVNFEKTGMAEFLTKKPKIKILKI